MQTIEYDLNVSGGLMPQINALTAPPTSDESNRRRKLKKSISRQTQLSNDSNNNNNFPNNRQILSRQTKTGKAPNHEYCDSCREGGDLLCCDRCPNAFHLQCHDPPLDEEDVPQGEWLCRKCKISNNEVLMESEDESDDCEDSDEWSERNPKWIQRPFSLLIRAAQTLNPKQFQLPNDMTPSIQLVGTSKRVNHNNNNNNKNALKKQFHEMDNNLVSFPVKLCYQCSRSCRKATLIQCDYCPLLFHADCLDPPLPVLPTGRWMCPNHPQHISEQKLLDSVRLTERVKLWDQFSGPISQDTIKLDFLRKVHRKDPVFRIKTCLPKTNRVKVPEAIKEMYKRRPKLLPNMSSLTAYDSNYSNSFRTKEVENECLNSHPFERPTLEQQEEWLSSLIAFQSSAAQYLSSQKHFDSKTNSSFAITSTKDNNELSLKSNETSVKYNSQTLSNGPTDHSSDDSNCLKKETNSDNKELMTQTMDNMRQLNGNQNCCSPTSSASDKRISNAINCVTNIESIEDMNKLDESVIRLFAFQRIQQMNNKYVESNHISTPNLNPIHSFQTTVRRIGLNDVRARAVLCPILIKSSTGSSSGPTIVMSYRTLTIGTSSENDVVLGEYGHCNYVSARHASIFYDETSRNYELINYSEHGTTVDNVLYSCDFSDKKVHNPKHSYVNSQSVSTVKAIIGSKRKRKSIENNKRLKNVIPNEESNSEKNKSKVKRKSFKSKEIEENAQKANDLKTNKIVFRKDYDSENVERVCVQTQSPLTMSSKARHAYKPCACKSSCSSLIGPNGAGWEGTALLHHGSHLKIGCNQFIFSITNHGITAKPTIQSTPNPSTAKSAIKTESLSSK